jgi:hypothetical protein
MRLRNDGILRCHSPDLANLQLLQRTALLVNGSTSCLTGLLGVSHCARRNSHGTDLGSAEGSNASPLSAREA